MQTIEEIDVSKFKLTIDEVTRLFGNDFFKNAESNGTIEVVTSLLSSTFVVHFLYENLEDDPLKLIHLLMRLHKMGVGIGHLEQLCVYSETNNLMFQEFQNARDVYAYIFKMIASRSGAKYLVEAQLKDKNFESSWLTIGFNAAVVKGNTQVAQVLIADPRFSFEFENGYKLIEVAARKGHVEIVKWCLSDSRINPMVEHNTIIFRYFETAIKEKFTLNFERILSALSHLKRHGVVDALSVDIVCKNLQHEDFLIKLHQNGLLNLFLRMRPQKEFYNYSIWHYSKPHPNASIFEFLFILANEIGYELIVQELLLIEYHQTFNYFGFIQEALSRTNSSNFAMSVLKGLSQLNLDLNLDEKTIKLAKDIGSKHNCMDLINKILLPQNAASMSDIPVGYQSLNFLNSTDLGKNEDDSQCNISNGLDLK